MKLRRPLWLLLSLTLLLGQWLTLAHAAEHTQPHYDDGLCVLCIQTQNLEQAQIAGIHCLHVVHAHTDAASQTDTAPAQAPRLQANIRAPPIFVV